MMKISQIFTKLASGRNAAWAALALVIIMPLFFTVPFHSLQAHGLLIDQHFTFSSVQVHDILTSYGVGGRQAYIRAEIVDFVVIPVVAFSIALIISYGFKRVGWPTGFNIIPLLLAVLNGLKGILLALVTLGYPHESTTLVAAANGVNLLKSLLMGVTIALLLTAILTLFRKSRASFSSGASS